MATSDISMRDRVAMLRLPDRTESAGGGKTAWLPWMLCLLLAGSCLSLVIRAQFAPTIEAAPVATAPTGQPAAPASTSPTTTPAIGSVAFESKGYIVPAHQIQVSPIEVSGRIVETFIEEGKHFEKGAILARLDDESFRAEFNEAAANVLAIKARRDEYVAGARPEEVEQAFADWKETEESMKQAKLEYERNKNLSTGALSASEFEKAQYAYSSLVQRVRKLERMYELVKLGPRKERIAAAEAEVNLAEAKAKRAKWRLDNCTIKAPVSGTVLKKSAEIGNLVSPLSFNVASSVCEMADLSQLEAELEIPERDISKITKGMRCKVTTDAYPDRMNDGVVDRLMPIALQNKAAIQVRVKLTIPKDEEGVYLKPGMNTRVTFLQTAETK